MALSNKSSILGPKPSQTVRGKSGESKLLSQATIVKGTSLLGNPNTNKLSQSPNIENKSPIGNANSSKLTQATVVKSQSPLGNPTTNKLNQSPAIISSTPVGNPVSSKVAETQTSRLTKSQSFTRGSFFQSFSGTTKFGASATPPPLTPLQLFFQRTFTSTQENVNPITNFFNNINTLTI